MIVCAAFAMLATAAPAYAYYYESTTTVITDCIVCHGAEAPTESDSSGPHGGYTTTTNKCATCHSVHSAVSGGIVLLPAATVRGTCETCHDGTGGTGVYGAIEAQLGPGSVKATHDFECSNCHSPHGNNLVAAFTGDRARVTTTTVITSARLLKKRPGSAAADIDQYGSDWCGACHEDRLSGSGKQANHPVDSDEATTGTFFTYDNVARVTGVGASSTTMGTLGRSNFGYVMPDNYSVDDTRSPEQRGHAPICQQCHEDVRSVGNVTGQRIAATEVFSINTTDGVQPPTSNPRFQTFPHESQQKAFLIEKPGDSLCLNCHAG